MRVQLDLINEQVLTRIIQYVTPKIDGLTKKNFSKSAREETPTILPFVNIKRITGVEVANTLEADKINGALMTFQVKVTSNESEDEAKTIMDEVGKAFKSMGFRATSLPLDNDVDNLHIKIARWQRELDEGDAL